MNLLECYEHVDKFIIMEYNMTHTGRKREYIFDKYVHLFPQDKMDKILYIASDISKETIETDNENIIHKVNEVIMRGNFVKHVNLKDNDIIISVDADEIIYSQSYDEIIKYTNEKDQCLLSLNQFFFKYNYFWSDLIFMAPSASKYKMYKNIYPSQWRYLTNKYPNIVGCHFSFCMSVDDMIYKINTYSHPTNRKFANKEYLNNCINNKIYPFEKRPFTIKELNDDECKEMLPKSFWEVEKTISNI